MKIFEQLEALKIGSVSLGSLLSAIVLFAVCLVVIKLLNRMISRLLGKSKHLPLKIKDIVASAIRCVLWIIAMLIILDALGISVTSLVALVSVVGLALSLSIQDILGNLFSGITLLMTKPIAVSDYIELDGERGTVKSIGIFYTVISTDDNRLIYYPNSDVTATRITNLLAQETRRIDFTVGVSYDCPTELMHKAVQEAAEANSFVLAEPEAYTYISDFGSSNIDYAVRVWVKSKDYWPTIFSIREDIRAALDRNGISIDYDHINVHTAD